MDGVGSNPTLVAVYRFIGVLTQDYLGVNKGLGVANDKAIRPGIYSKRASPNQPLSRILREFC